MVNSEKLQQILKTISNEFKDEEYTIELWTNELTSICPYTNLPDFYELLIIYIPCKNILELKSLKFYLSEFRNIKITHESLLNVIFKHLLNLLKPKYLKVELHVNIRGGVKAKLKREYGGNYEAN